MSSFQIKLEPEVEATPRSDKSFDLGSKEVVRRAMFLPEEYNILYLVDGEPFCYYPSQIFIAFGDLEYEWGRFKRRESHTMQITGYPVLDAKFSTNDVTLHELSTINGAGKEIGKFPASLLEGKFEESAGILRNRIQHLLGASKI